MLLNYLQMSTNIQICTGKKNCIGNWRTCNRHRTCSYQSCSYLIHIIFTISHTEMISMIDNLESKHLSMKQREIYSEKLIIIRSSLKLIAMLIRSDLGAGNPFNAYNTCCFSVENYVSIEFVVINSYLINRHNAI